MATQEPEARRISVVSRRVEKIAWEVDATDPEDAAFRYLADGDEVGSRTESQELVELDGRQVGPTSYEVRASLEIGDRNEPVAVVRVGPADVTLHSSLVDPDTVNVEIDGAFAGNPDNLRVNVNDIVVYDSRLPLTQQFSAEEIEVLLRTCAELYDNSDDDTGTYLSGLQQELAAAVLRASSHIDGDPRKSGTRE